jgi:hypothetical protein
MAHPIQRNYQQADASQPLRRQHADDGRSPQQDRTSLSRPIKSSMWGFDVTPKPPARFGQAGLCIEVVKSMRLRSAGGYLVGRELRRVHQRAL